MEKRAYTYLELRFFSVVVFSNIFHFKSKKKLKHHIIYIVSSFFLYLCILSTARGFYLWSNLTDRGFVHSRSVISLLARTHRNLVNKMRIGSRFGQQTSVLMLSNSSNCEKNKGQNDTNHGLFRQVKTVKAIADCQDSWS